MSSIFFFIIFDSAEEILFMGTGQGNYIMWVEKAKNQGKEREEKKNYDRGGRKGRDAAAVRENQTGKKTRSIQKVE